MGEFTQTQSFILWWNSTFPFDLMWRKKHKIAFMSPAHKNTSLYDIYFDIYEESYLKKLMEEEDQRKEDREFYEMTGHYLKKKSKYLEMDSAEVDNFIENIDLDLINQLDDQSKIKL